MSSHTSGQVLGAATAVGGAIASLPATGSRPLALSLAALSAIAGLAVLGSFVATRILRRLR